MIWAEVPGAISAVGQRRLQVRALLGEHGRTITEIGEGTVRSVRSCGRRGEVCGADKTCGVMDPLPQEGGGRGPARVGKRPRR